MLVAWKPWIVVGETRSESVVVASKDRHNAHRRRRSCKFARVPMKFYAKTTNIASILRFSESFEIAKLSMDSHWF